MADPLRIVSLCSGVGMLDVGVELGLAYLGIPSRVLCYVEREAFAASRLLERMEDEALEPSPVWCGDLQAVRWSRFRGMADLVVAGFPCQPVSVAGKQLATDDERWIWPHIADAIRDVRPRFVFLENVRGLLAGHGGLDAVYASLAGLGFHAERSLLSAQAAGASHQRERVFILAYRPGGRLGERGQSPERNGLAHWSNAKLADGARNGCSGGDLHEPARRLDPNDARWSGADVADGEREGWGFSPLSDEAGFCGMEEQGEPWRSERGRDALGRSFVERERVAVPSDQRRERSTQAGREALARTEHASVMGDAERARPQGPGSRFEERRRVSGASSADGRNDALPLFAPGPLDPRWARIIAYRPDLAPAIEPGLRVLVDGLAYVVDESRADQLRAGGNGVVPAQAACALVELARRAGII